MPPDQAATVLAAMLNPAMSIGNDETRKYQVDRIVAKLTDMPDAKMMLKLADPNAVARSLAQHPGEAVQDADTGFDVELGILLGRDQECAPDHVDAFVGALRRGRVIVPPGLACRNSHRTLSPSVGDSALSQTTMQASSVPSTGGS